MSDTIRKRLAKLVLTVSLLVGTALVATTTSFEAAWTEGNSQPQSGLLLGGKEHFVAGNNETHTGSLTALP